MKTLASGFVMAMLASTLGGCAAGPPPEAATAERWERISVTDGVEIHVSSNAGPAATQVVEQLRTEMRSRYLGAR